MFVKASLVDHIQDFLWYEVPHEWQDKISIGSIIKVPLRNRQVLAFVEQIYRQRPQVEFAIKSLITVELLFGDEYYLTFIQKISAYYTISKLTILRRIKHILNQKPKEIIADINQFPIKEITLSNEQQEVATQIKAAIGTNHYQSFLLHGVTGSGKTEVYKEVIHEALQSGKSVIYLVPEVTLAIQFSLIFQTRFLQEIICSFHSATSASEKRRLWQRLQDKKPCLIIGVHLPVLLPIANLGLIIVDEEHEIGYQEKKFPKINSKEAALLRAQLYHIPIVLGSATPSLSSFCNVQYRGWKLLVLYKRFSGNFPRIHLVNLRDYKQRKEFWLSDDLRNAINDRLQKKEQTIIFLNRRGHSFFVQCKQCSFVFVCSQCSVSLTLHDNGILKCHYCDFLQRLPTHCIKCQSTEFINKGIGTQQAIKILQKVFPAACIERADMDATVNRKRWQKIVDQMHDGTIDILVGTQTITKGYDFKKVTLVGILWADLNLHFPIYNASEITLQQLIQVAGRAGRHSTESLVIVQTMSEHTIFSYLNEESYYEFLQKELAQRTLSQYPPVVRLAEIELRNSNEKILHEEAQQLSELLKGSSSKVTILGPASPPIEKIKHIFRKKLYLKAYSHIDIQHLISNIDRKKFQSELLFQPNPLS